MFRISRLALICAIGLAPSPALARGMPADETPAAEDPLARALPLSDAELAQARGGFVIGGMTVSLGADLRTFLNGELVLQTLLTWGNGGVETQQFVSAALTPATADQLRAGMLSNGAIRMQFGGEQVFLANEGQTALIHNVDNGFQNVLLNTASNTVVRQEMDLTIGLSGYDGFRDSLYNGALPQGMALEIDAAAAGIAGN